MNSRSCNECTKCCEGFLSGKALGYDFFVGKPCHFVDINKGCSVYKQRPISPCKSYKCFWLSNTDMPQWMKPSFVNAIVDMRNVDGIEYMAINEAGSRLDSRVLSWAIEYCLSKQINLYWIVESYIHWIGTPDFNDAIIKNQMNFPKDNFPHSKPNFSPNQALEE